MTKDCLKQTMRTHVSMFRAGGSVKRYHVMPTVGHQTVAEHSYHVACLLHLLTPDVSANLLKAALFHDLAEQETGDVPATAKWYCSMLKDVLSELEDDFNLRYNTVVELYPSERALLKIADTMELVCYCVDQMMFGNHHALEVARRGINHLESLKPFNDNTEALFESLAQQVNKFERQFTHV